MGSQVFYLPWLSIALNFNRFDRFAIYLYYRMMGCLPKTAKLCLERMFGPES